MKNEEYKRDIEETDAVLDLEEPNPLEFWEKKQRELITSVVDYNLGTLADLIHKDIDLSPEYQRRFRWDEVRQSKLIESFLMNVPVPPVFLNEDVYGHYSVIDGKQRLTTVYEFIRGRLQLKGLEVFSDINGLNYGNLPPRLQTVLRTRPTLRAVIILRQSDEDVKFEVFQRLNTGGVHLNPQEIRNSTFTGPLNNLILELSVNKQFHRLLGIKNKERSAIYQEMRDAEFVLRYLTFRDTWEKFSGGMKRQMDRYMSENRRMPEKTLTEVKKDFLNTINIVEACFGEHAFKRWLPERKLWRQQVLASLYDAQMFACRGLGTEKLLAKRRNILSALQGLFSNNEFRKSIDAATNAPGLFRTRIMMVRETLQTFLD
jgi:hypothetical protein